ncbi:MAG TPA: GNAT family N-acetyltransferase, partial [Armatimonadota bacterium]
TMRPYDENYPPATEIIEGYFHYLVDAVAELSGTFFLAEDDGNPIGFACVFGLMPPFSPDEEPREYTFVSDLYVDPAYRGRGIGKALLQRAEAYGRTLGAPRIELATHAGNPALAFYRQLGFDQRLVIMTKRLDR